MFTQETSLQVETDIEATTKIAPPSPNNAIAGASVSNQSQIRRRRSIVTPFAFLPIKSLCRSPTHAHPHRCHSMASADEQENNWPLWTGSHANKMKDAHTNAVSNHQSSALRKAWITIRTHPVTFGRAIVSASNRQLTGDGFVPGMYKSGRLSLTVERFLSLGAVHGTACIHLSMPRQSTQDRCISQRISVYNPAHLRTCLRNPPGDPNFSSSSAVDT